MMVSTSDIRRAVQSEIVRFDQTRLWDDYGLFMETRGYLDVDGDMVPYEIVQEQGFSQSWGDFHEGYGSEASLVLKVYDTFYRIDGEMYSHGGFEMEAVYEAVPKQVVETVYERTN